MHGKQGLQLVISYSVEPAYYCFVGNFVYDLWVFYNLQQNSVNSVQQLIPMVTINLFTKSGLLFISTDLIGLFSLIANMDPFQTAWNLSIKLMQ